jgi:tetratricopeptide (TPR) repeat protein
MDEKDVITQLRNSFYLGNYYKAIETFKEHANIPFSKYENLAKSLFIRSLVKLGKKYLKAIENFNVSPIAKECEMCLKYLGPLNVEVSVEEATKILNDFKNNVKDNTYIAQEITKLLLIAKREFAQLLKEEKNKLDLESQALQFYCYMGLKRVDLCEKTLKVMQTIDEEDVLTGICQVYLQIMNRNYEEAIKMIEEIKAKYEDSTKLANLKGLCYIALGRYEDASVLLYKLYSIMNGDEKFNDPYELEVTLSHLIILAGHPDFVKKIQGETKDDFIKILKELNPASAFLKKSQLV